MDIILLQRLLREKISHRGYDLLSLSYHLPLLFTFLRHLGCAFCHRTLLDLKTQLQAIHMQGVDLVLVHMASQEDADDVFDLYGLQHTIRVPDPQQELYRVFDLKRGKLQRIFNPRIWLEGSGATALSNDEINLSMGDPLQMPGVFLVYRGEVLRSFRHKTIQPAPIMLLWQISNKTFLSRIQEAECRTCRRTKRRAMPFP